MDSMDVEAQLNLSLDELIAQQTSQKGAPAARAKRASKGRASRGADDSMDVDAPKKQLSVTVDNKLKPQGAGVGKKSARAAPGFKSAPRTLPAVRACLARASAVGGLAYLAQRLSRPARALRRPQGLPAWSGAGEGSAARTCRTTRSGRAWTWTTWPGATTCSRRRARPSRGACRRRVQAPSRQRVG